MGQQFSTAFSTAMGCHAPVFGQKAPAPKNSAFVFIKPHANTEATKALVKAQVLPQ
jgi:hypothetical protein